jgi:hypothetical protein
MKMANLHHINRLLIEEGWGGEVAISMPQIAKRVGIDDISSISRYITKLEEMEKIKIIRTNTTNNYVILDKEPVAIDYMEPISEKQNALLRHYVYKFGIRVFRAITKKLQLPVWINNLTVEQASDIIAYYKQNEKTIICDYDEWIKTVANFPEQYEYTHYQDLIDEAVEINLVLPYSHIDSMVNKFPMVMMKKDKKVFHAKTYCFTHFDLIYMGYTHHQWQGQDYYFYTNE